MAASLVKRAEESVHTTGVGDGQQSEAQVLVGAGRGTFDELRLLTQRSLVRFHAFHAHERRAAHEAKVLEMLLRELDDTGCVVVADWKVITE